MDTMKAFMMGRLSKGRELKVFDWVEAVELIKEHGATSASAGLSGDWEYTGGHILQDGKPVPAEDAYTSLASTWATPQIEIDGELYDCYTMRSIRPEWDSDTYWPEEALELLNK